MLAWCGTSPPIYRRGVYPYLRKWGRSAGRPFGIFVAIPNQDTRHPTRRRTPARVSIAHRYLLFRPEGVSSSFLRSRPYIEEDAVFIIHLGREVDRRLPTSNALMGRSASLANSPRLVLCALYFTLSMQSLSFAWLAIPRYHRKNDRVLPRTKQTESAPQSRSRNGSLHFRLEDQALHSGVFVGGISPLSFDTPR